MKRHFLLAFATLAISSIASAELKLASVFTDNLVLQREMIVPVWGTADAGKKITITVGNAYTAEGTADEKGHFLVKLPAMKPGTLQQMTVSEEGGNTVRLANVAIGDVWVCSGQSNMGFQLWQASNAKAVLPDSNDADLRLLVVEKTVATKPLKEIKGSWQVSSPDSAKTFSAVGWFFGEDLRNTQKIPIGLIGTYWGGTPAEAWTPWEAMEKDPELKPILERYQKGVTNWGRRGNEYEAKLKAWEEAKAKDPNFKQHRPAPVDVTKSPYSPSVLYNGMVAPLVPFAIKGVIWYQGESNTVRAEQYADLFPTMIRSWRQAWGQGDFPFFFVQLANFMSKQDTAEGSPWAELREAQLETVKREPNTGMAVIIDVGTPKGIHPPDKQTVGHRLALIARQDVYGEKNLQANGPLYKSMKIEGDKIVITFTSAQGLTAKGGELKQFAIAGEDKKFVPAKAVIEGNTVVVSSPEVKQPVAVRYAWSDNPEGANLYNAAGLPASPFKTDDWPWVTAGKR